VTGVQPLDHYFEVLTGDGRRPGNLRFEMDKLFSGVPFAGRSVLDIGAGSGDTSLYAACSGAELVVALEPEAAGSDTDVRGTFARRSEQLGTGQVALRAETLQGFDPGGQQFDVIVSKASINHLDEPACMRLHIDPAARNTYLEILGKLGDLARPGADLVVHDCSRLNVFDRLGLRNPIARTIEWEKHQSPKLWARLLEDVGFEQPHIRWLSFNSLRRPGQLLLGNRVGAFLTTSQFCLTMKRG
jgi:SAM-dependent methyltransferase